MLLRKLLLPFLVLFCLFPGLPPGERGTVGFGSRQPELQVNLKPQPLGGESAARVPANPVLCWVSVPGAVYYEFELLSAPPENPNGIAPSIYRLHSTREVFTAGLQVDLDRHGLSQYYWRVRGLDYDGNPCGVFSDTQALTRDYAIPPVSKPLITARFNLNGMPTPLYPVYAWIPVLGAAGYEVELLDAPPENPNGLQPSRHRIWHDRVKGGFDCYDDEARVIPGKYYWRVRAIDSNGQPLGTFSDVGEFLVDPTSGRYAATLGDSITHGGGAVSYSPSDWEYDYQTYLPFTAVNLGRSGDTSTTMMERFERDVLPYQPRYLLIMGGTNSLRGSGSAQQVIRDFALLRDKCTDAGIRPIFLTLPPINPQAIERVFNEGTDPNWREKFRTVNQFIRRQPYHIDLEPYFQSPGGILPAHFAVDGLHLDISGKRLMAEIISQEWERVTQ